AGTLRELWGCWPGPDELGYRRTESWPRSAHAHRLRVVLRREQGLDLRPVAFFDHAAAHLHGRGKLPVGDGELVRYQHELLDGLILGEVLIHLGDDAFI